MRVCFLNHDLKDNTGAGRFGLQLIANLGRKYPNFHPVVLTAEGCGHPLERPLLSPGISSFIFSFPAIRAAFKGCDVIHALDGYPFGVIAAIASLGLGKKLIITAIGTGAVQAFRHTTKGMFLRWAYRRADKLVAVSNYTKREILKECPGIDIAVINHAVDAEEFSGSDGDDLTENEKLDIERLRPYILSVGAWKKRKGYEYSFQAFAEVARYFPDIKYVVVGAAKPKPQLSEPLGITDRVFYFIGVRRPFLRALYRNAELFMLLPYDDGGDVEGFGFAFLEAAAAGLPVVGTYHSGAEDAIDNGNNGFLVEPKNHKAAAEAAIKILSDGTLKEKFAKGSIAFARKMNWAKVVAEYGLIYENMLRQP